MSDGERLFLYSLAVTVIVLIISVTSCNMHQNYSVTEMVKAGANPILARCSVGGATEIVCSQALRDSKEK